MDAVRSVPVVTEARLLAGGSVFAAYVGALGLLVEALVVLLPGVAYSGTQIYAAFHLSLYLSFVSLALLIATVPVWLARRKNMANRMPRVPYTIASVLAYVYAARMLDAMVGMSAMAGGERNRVLRSGMGDTYFLGETVGADGKRRVGIDRHEAVAG